MTNWINPQTKKEIVKAFPSDLEKAITEERNEILNNPTLGGQIVQEEVTKLNDKLSAAATVRPPHDYGVQQLVGLGNTATALEEIAVPYEGVDSYEDDVDFERVQAMAMLYYIYQLEVPIGVFRSVLKLQELFVAGTVRLSSGEGAGRLYRYDRRKVLRYTRRDRHQAYIRAFGYGKAAPAPGATPNRDFHRLFTNFNNRVAIYWRDKRISEVVRPRTNDPSFGSIAIVRRAGLDLRHNLKHFSYGYLNVMTRETRGLLDEAFAILNADDIKDLYGAKTAWDVIEEVYMRYMKRPPSNISARHGMASSGMKILEWLAQPFVKSTDQVVFENELYLIADQCEEWLTSAESLGVARFARPDPTTSSLAMVSPTYPARATESEFEMEV